MSFDFFHYHFNRKEVRRIDRAALVVGVLQPFTTLPQIWEIYQTGSAANVSLWAWLTSALSGLVFLWYGIAHRLKPIIITQVLWFVLQMIVVAEILLYG